MAIGPAASGHSSRSDAEAADFRGPLCLCSHPVVALYACRESPTGTKGASPGPHDRRSRESPLRFPTPIADRLPNRALFPPQEASPMPPAWSNRKRLTAHRINRSDTLDEMDQLHPTVQ